MTEYETELILSLNGDTFADLKNDFDRLLQSTLHNMQKYEKNAADMTIKLQIHLDEDVVKDINDDGYEEHRRVLVPSFVHDITSVYQTKQKISGFLAGQYELAQDHTNAYVMRKIEHGQLTMFN